MKANHRINAVICFLASLLRADRLERGGEARFLACGGIGFNETSLVRLVDSLVGGWEERFGLLGVLGGNRLSERLGCLVEVILATQVIHALPCRRANRLFC